MKPLPCRYLPQAHVTTLTTRYVVASSPATKLSPATPATELGLQITNGVNYGVINFNGGVPLPIKFHVLKPATELGLRITPF